MLSTKEISLELHEWTTAEYQQLIKAGVLDEDARLELLNGQLVKMSPVGSRHAACTRFLVVFFQSKLGDNYLFDSQNPIEINDYSEPEPDFTLLKWRADYYASQLPRPDDILLLVEVADSSLVKDQEVKRVIYAQAKVPEYWILDIDNLQLEVYSSPESGDYQHKKVFTIEEEYQHSLVGSVNVKKLFPWL